MNPCEGVRGSKRVRRRGIQQRTVAIQHALDRISQVRQAEIEKTIGGPAAVFFADEEEGRRK